MSDINIFTKDSITLAANTLHIHIDRVMKFIETKLTTYDIDSQATATVTSTKKTYDNNETTTSATTASTSTIDINSFRDGLNDITPNDKNYNYRTSILLTAGFVTLGTIIGSVYLSSKNRNIQSSSSSSSS